MQANRWTDYLACEQIPDRPGSEATPGVGKSLACAMGRWEANAHQTEPNNVATHCEHGIISTPRTIMILVEVYEEGKTENITTA